jgi:hypothetical protein
MTNLTRKLGESVVRTEIRKLNDRIDALESQSPRVRRARLQYIKQDFARITRTARKWGLQVPRTLC